MFHDAYHQYLTPVGGMSFWPDCSEMSKVLPRKPKKMHGRPRKKRIRASHETKYPNKISRSEVQMTCSNCFQKGHNKSGYKNQTVLLPPEPPTKKGRPRKNLIPSESIDDQTDPLVPQSVLIHLVKEHLGSSQYELGGYSSTVNASKTKKRVTFKENVANRGLSISGRGRGRGPRLGRLGAWFENKDNWSWFLELLGEDLEFPTGNGLTLMSDQHKGLIEAVKDKMMELIKGQQRFWHVIPTGGNLFEERNRSQAYSIDEQHRTCSCRIWQLLGFPCSHAISVIFKLNRRTEEYVPDCFRKRMFHDAYHQYLTPVGGMSFWPDCSEMSKVLPRKPKKMHGRPRKKRIRASHETKYPNKISRSEVQMTCSNCFQKGHNKSGYKNQTVLLPPEPPTKKGRPRKNLIPSESIDDQTDPLVPQSVLIHLVKEHLVDNQVMPVNKPVPREPLPRAMRNLSLQGKKEGVKESLKERLQRIT
nr:pentatricopeptide repeat-containing protein [Tanacetum cinerariifolium]